jgi:iron complex transport system substrate-binding protein
LPKFEPLRRQPIRILGGTDMKRLFSLLLLGAALALVAAACGEDEQAGTTATAPPTGTAAPATATPTGAAEGYPLTVNDMLDRSVDIETEPQRVVATSPTTVEMVYAVGGTLVAHDASSNYPPEVADLPAVGRAYAPDFEGIVAQNPDLVIADSINQARFLQQFEALSVPVLMVGAASFEEVETGMQLVAQALGLSSEAELAIAKLEQERDDLIAQVPDQPVKALILIMDADQRIYAAKPDTYVGSLAQALKAENPATGLSGAAGPYPGYVLLSAEQAVTENPDVILTISPAPAPAPKLSDVLKGVPGYSDLDAVKTGKVHELDVDLFLQAPGPRVVEAMRAMFELLYGTTPVAPGE